MLSGSERLATAGRASYLISISKASADPAERPVFGEQISICTAFSRPEADRRIRPRIGALGATAYAPVIASFVDGKDTEGAAFVCNNMYDIDNYLTRIWRPY